jgi:hypothetical protein
MHWDVDKLWDFLSQKSKASKAFTGWCVYQLSYHGGTLRLKMYHSGTLLVLVFSLCTL